MKLSRQISEQDAATVVVEPMALIERARSAAAHAYAPYSEFPVGAAVVDDKGRVFVGVNIENASHGLTICAERVAVFSAVAAGARQIRAVALTAKRRPAISPCGACRQVLAEFCEPNALVHSDAGNGKIKTWTVGELLPAAFEPKDLLGDR